MFLGTFFWFFSGKVSSLSLFLTWQNLMVFRLLYVGTVFHFLVLSGLDGGRLNAGSTCCGAFADWAGSCRMAFDECLGRKLSSGTGCGQ